MCCVGVPYFQFLLDELSQMNYYKVIKIITFGAR